MYTSNIFFQTLHYSSFLKKLQSFCKKRDILEIYLMKRQKRENFGARFIDKHRKISYNKKRKGADP
jgi:hypothetical protein